MQATRLIAALMVAFVCGWTFFKSRAIAAKMNGAAETRDVDTSSDPAWSTGRLDTPTPDSKDRSKAVPGPIAFVMQYFSAFFLGAEESEPECQATGAVHCDDGPYRRRSNKYWVHQRDGYGDPYYNIMHKARNPYVRDSTP